MAELDFYIHVKSNADGTAAECTMIPSADVAPVKRGIITKDGACSICGYYIPTDSAHDAIFHEEVKYCYHCGAKMEVDGDV